MKCFFFAICRKSFSSLRSSSVAETKTKLEIISRSVSFAFLSYHFFHLHFLLLSFYFTTASHTTRSHYILIAPDLKGVTVAKKWLIKSCISYSMDSLGGKNNNYRGKSRFSILECEKGKGGKRMEKEGLWGGYITTHTHSVWKKR